MAKRCVLMHGHRHIDWIGECGGLVIVSAPSTIMEVTNDLDTYFYIHTLEVGGDGCLRLLAPQALTFLEIVRAKMVPSIWLRTKDLPSEVPVDKPPSLGRRCPRKDAQGDACAILRRGNHMSGTGRNALIICASVLAIAALYFARSVFAPAAVSLFAVAVVWPVRSGLRSDCPNLSLWPSRSC